MDGHYKNSELMTQGFVVHDNWPDLKNIKKPLTFLREV